MRSEVVVSSAVVAMSASSILPGRVPFALVPGAAGRPSDHHPQDAGIGLGIERLDNSTRVIEFRGRRGEGRIDHADLSGVDRELAGEAFAGRCLSLGQKALLVTEVGEHTVHGLDASGNRSGKAERARKLVGEAKAAVGIVFRRCAESG